MAIRHSKILIKRGTKESLAVNKQQHEEIKQLKKDIKDIKDHLGL